MKCKESETVELKPSLSQMERVLKTVCGFLNHKGGIIYFGISNKGEVMGQVATDSNLRKISQQIGSRIKPAVVPVIEEIDVEGLPVIKVTVEKYNKELNYFDAVPYTRSGTETIAMPPDDLIQKGEKKGRYYQLIGHDIGHDIGHKEDTVKGN